MVSYRAIAPERTGDRPDVMTAWFQRFEPDLSDLSLLADNEIPLAHSVLRIALTEYPRLDPDRWLGEIDRLADRARTRATDGDEASLIDALDAALFVEAGFHGNSALYYDPRNSFLNDVLERRTGIPITLSIVYIETGRRLGLDLFGIGLPGHFLVGHRATDGSTQVIDAFNRGSRLAREDCVRLVEENGGDARTFEERFLLPVSHRNILLRMLTNLKLIYVNNRDFARAVRVMDRSLEVAPEQWSELRDRGLVLLQNGEPGKALRDLKRYIELAPLSDDEQPVRQAIAAAQRLIAQLN